MMLVLLLLCCMFWCGHGLTFEVGSTEERCVFDTMRKDVLATGEYTVLGQDTAQVSVDIQVTGPTGEEVFAQQKKEHGKFGFTAQHDGDYNVCFKNHDMVTRRIHLHLKSGAEAKDLSEIVQRDHLKPLSVELLRIKETIADIGLELRKLQSREREMRDINETINSRVTWFSIFSVAVVASLGVWQVLHLKNYFAAKKLI
mmetsp:Transcript_1332/g.2170  ORF Transcript_1332/g.2170 Transcript_1332/m.2170 type:complete len:200 (-) Transcript_1332:22-621(-)